VERALELLQSGDERFGDESSAEFAVVTGSRCDAQGIRS
jgi:hypothetical protein